MSRIVVSGYYGSKNAGDEAMLSAMLEVLSDLDPKLHITVISADPEDTRKRHGVDAISWLGFPAIIKELRQADLLISGGGSLLQNVTSRRSLYYYMFIIMLAHFLGTKVMLYAQGIGPIIGRVAEMAMRFLGNHVDLITVRDEGSLKELARLGIHKTIIECTADPVLAIHPVGKEAGRAIFKAYHADGAKPVLGISVREWQGWRHYKEVLAEVSDMVVRELGARVVFIPMQFPDDVKAAQAIASLTKEECTVLKDEYTTSEFLSLVGNMDLMLGIRLHALIFAGVMGVPMLGISYDPKIDRFLASIGEEPVGNLKDVTAEELMAEIRRKWNDKQTFRQKNGELLAQLRDMAAHNAELAVNLAHK
ncbi:MAG: polysaccharide pyruvyl transferase CsaB [Selenomonas ruminantium]|uniref:Polysaccharide pyruvyl transferase CsaB n=1 Tax=Selenomonas ruminantium TaxID=971 RepID=A0A927WHZ5_SELRU|nr:polysaccharide pyruvyl transferase CsaB [Selenomonas ruminantium]MBE6084349.1 polysaccharide pyruvyl transferase CsaB [Selenomonas ruminantium]